MSALPDGTLTFLFTDVEGSSGRWERDRSAMSEALRRHDEIVRAAIGAHEGIVFAAIGDAFRAVFARAEAAADAAFEIRRALAAVDWSAIGGMPVRIALHAGSAVPSGNTYTGPAIDNASALVTVCNGDQTIVSQTAAMLLAGALSQSLSLAPVGTMRLGDDERASEIYQLEIRGESRRFPAFRDHQEPPTNLPRQFTSFIGRTAELDELRTLLAQSRIVTLCGPGGVGKTRTALALGASVLSEFKDGVWFVSFSAIADPAMLAEAACAALAIGERRTKSARETLVDHLVRRRSLLLFDNCEHVVGGAAELVTHIERACPNVSVFATSREVLRTAGERVYVLKPLAVPAASERLPSLDDLENSPAVALFLERARSASQGLRYEQRERQAVAQLCVRLDGLPLAIELAAARANVYPPSVLAKLIERRFEVLPPLAAGGTSPHRTLYGLVAWSYDLLSDQEQMLFRRLAIFSGGWTVEAAETVTSGSGLDGREVFGLLANLFDKSLIQRPGDDDDRFIFLETIRAYARDTLEACGELDAMRRAHVEYFAMLTLHAEPSFRSASQDIWLERFTVEYDNLRAALDASETAPALEKAGNVMCAGLARYWIIRGSLKEARLRLQRAAERRDVQPSTLVRVLCGAAIVALNERRASDFMAYAVRARDAARSIEDAWTVAYATVIYAAALAFTTTPSGTAGKVDAAIGEARRLADATADPWLFNHVDHAQIYRAETRGDVAAAASLEEIALRHAEAAGDKILIASSANYVAYRQRTTDPMRSALLLQRSGTLLAASHMQGLAALLECAVEIAFSANLFDVAARLMGAARRNRDASDSRAYRIDPDAHRASLKGMLGDERFISLVSEGAEWSFADAVAALASLPALIEHTNDDRRRARYR